MGKGVEPKSSRIFQQCYVKCCKLQNVAPLASVLGSPSAGSTGRVVDFCVDRLKYADWPPIINALSCDLTLHSVCIKCRTQAKTVLEHIDCERLAKTVSKRPVILTNFMLSNLVEAVAQLITNSTQITALALQGLPLKVPYLNPLCEALTANTSLQQLSLAGSGAGDAGCLAVCRAVRRLPRVIALDLSACDLTPAGASHIADLIKYQKIQRYSENWCHTLRYRTPRLEAMAGLRRITLCSNTQLGHAGAATLLDALADDLWIKALDLQDCGLVEATAASALRTLTSNTTLSVLDLRRNHISADALARLRTALRDNDRATHPQFTWLSGISGSSSEPRLVKPVGRNSLMKERMSSNVRTVPTKYPHKITTAKTETQYAEALEEQLQEEAAQRRRAEQMNAELLQQMQQLRSQPTSSGSELSLEASTSSSSGSSVPIEHSTLAYIQHAFHDIYTFIKNNQCHGQCLDATQHRDQKPIDTEAAAHGKHASHDGHVEHRERVYAGAKRAHSTHAPLPAAGDKGTKSAHLLGTLGQAKLEMIERQIGDAWNLHDSTNMLEERTLKKHSENNLGDAPDSPSDSDTLVSESRGGLVPRSPRSQRTPNSPCTPRSARSPRPSRVPTPRCALFSSDEDDDYD